jgi:hypothetical protein
MVRPLSWRPVVASGGWLSMGNEGWEVAQALADRGIAAFSGFDVEGSYL